MKIRLRAHLNVGGILLRLGWVRMEKRTKCNSCNKIYVIVRRKYAPSHLNCHAMKCHKNKTKDVGQMILDI